MLICSLISYSYGQTESQENIIPEEYIISPSNVLEIKVYQEPDLSTTLTVSQDGTINFPLLGTIKAAGLSIRELENVIREKLAEDYLIDPHVVIIIRQYTKKKVSILGEVRSPGSYEIKDKLTMTQAIALAGGFTDKADSSDVKIIRETQEEKESIEVNVSQIMEREERDIEVRDGDTIMVGEAGQIYIMGQVVRPGAYRYKKGMTVIEAIALAGGMTQIAAQNSVKLIRTVDGEKKIITVPVGSILGSGDKSQDVPLEEEDTVVVPESFF